MSMRDDSCLRCKEETGGDMLRVVFHRGLPEPYSIRMTVGKERILLAQLGFTPRSRKRTGQGELRGALRAPRRILSGCNVHAVASYRVPVATAQWE